MNAEFENDHANLAVRLLCFRIYRDLISGLTPSKVDLEWYVTQRKIDIDKLADFGIENDLVNEIALAKMILQKMA